MRALLHDRNADAVALRRIVGAPAVPVTAIFRAQRSVNNQATMFVTCFEEAYAALSSTIEERLP